MSALSDLMNEQPEDKRAAAYDDLAASAIAVFGVPAHEVLFLGHNSGAAYRVESADARRLLLKVHAPQGDSEGLSEHAILGGLKWLATIAEVTDLPVQAPVADPTGALFTECALPRLVAPVFAPAVAGRSPRRRTSHRPSPSRRRADGSVARRLRAARRDR